MSTATTAPKARPATGWWSESTDDGGGHYGTKSPRGVVKAVCGRKFVPLTNPYRQQPTPQGHPADEAHACPACRVALET